MEVIKSEQQLLKYIPNAIRQVQGESSLFYKIGVNLQQAEDWLVDNISGNQTLLEVMTFYSDDSVNSQLRDLFAQFVVNEALDRAIPSLDLVLTPNGFGVVSNNTVSPASKQRVDRLIGMVRSLRDEAIARSLELLPKVQSWLASEQADFFGRTMFPGVDIVQLCGKDTKEGKLWDTYLQLRSLCFGIELSLEEEFFSHELMEALRGELLSGVMLPHRLRLAQLIRQQIIDVLMDKPINGSRMRDLVNVIRSNPTRFPEWHASETATLFSPPRYVNKKSDKGFWF